MIPSREAIHKDHPDFRIDTARLTENAGKKQFPPFYCDISGNPVEKTLKDAILIIHRIPRVKDRVERGQENQ